MNFQDAITKIKNAGYAINLATNDAKLEAAREAKYINNKRLRRFKDESVRQNFNKPTYNIEGHFYTEREVIKFARSMVKVGNHNLKNFSKRTRSAERDAIKTERFDDIPQNDTLKREDPWSWD